MRGMLSRRRLLYALATLLLGGCSYTDRYDDNMELNAYVDSHTKDTMTIAEAAVAMENAGFSCGAFPDDVMALGAQAYPDEVLCRKTTRGGVFSDCHTEKQVQILDWDTRLCRYSDGEDSQDCREARHKIRVVNVGGDAVCRTM